MKNIKVFGFILFLFVFFNCNNSDDGCIYTKVEIESIDNLYGCEDSYLNISVNGNEAFYLIKDKESFNNYITSSCSFDIDFSKYDLIIGKYPVIPNKYELHKSCDGKFALDVIYLQGNQQDNVNIYTYHVLVKKGLITDKSNIIVSYTLIPK